MNEVSAENVSLREILRFRSVTLMLVASFCSSTAAVGLAVALGKLVFDISGRELDLGLIGLAEFLPTAFLVLIAGAMADRYNRQRIAAVGWVGESFALLGLFFYARSEPTETWPAFLLVFLFGAARGFLNPSARALPPSLAPSEYTPRVMSLYSASWQLAIVFGPIVAGFLYLAGPQWPFLVFAAMTLISATTVSLLTLHTAQEPSNERPSLATALEGLAFVRRTPILLAAIGLDLAAVLFGGAVALAPALAEDVLGVDAFGLGLLRSAGGVGAVLTAIVLANKPLTRFVGRRLLYAVAVFGVGTVALGFTESFVVALALLTLIAAADMVSVFVRITLVPLATPDAMRGRVLAVEAVFIGASNELGAFESGVTAEFFGLKPAIVMGGLATLIVVLVWWFVFPALRDVDRFEDVVAD